MSDISSAPLQSSHGPESTAGEKGCCQRVRSPANWRRWKWCSRKAMHTVSGKRFCSQHAKKRNPQ